MALKSDQLCLRRCLQCGTGWTYPRPSVAELESQYSQSYYGPENVKFISIMEGIVEWITARRAKWIDQQIEGHSRILEIGCGRGLLLSSLSQLGHECHGTERSELAARRALRQVGIKVQVGALEKSHFQRDYFDLVVLWHVLEHLENPAETLALAGELLRIGGLLIVEVPNLTSLQSRLTGRHWLHLDLERHLFHFSAQGLRTLLETTGFEVTAKGTFSWEQCPFGALQSFLNCLGTQPDIFYKILKREVVLSLPARILHYALAGTLVLPATAFAGFEVLWGDGGVVRLTARKSQRSRI
jgi:SAM-dependent methyltransferase